MMSQAIHNFAYQQKIVSKQTYSIHSLLNMHYTAKTACNIKPKISQARGTGAEFIGLGEVSKSSLNCLGRIVTIFK